MVNSKSLIEHHCTIMNHTRIATATVMNGDVVVEDGAYLGSMICFSLTIATVSHLDWFASTVMKS